MLTNEVEHEKIQVEISMDETTAQSPQSDAVANAGSQVPQAQEPSPPVQPASAVDGTQQASTPQPAPPSPQQVQTPPPSVQYGSHNATAQVPPKPPAVTQPTTSTTPVSVPSVQNQNPFMKFAKHKWMIGIVVGIVLFLSVLGGVVWWYLLSNGNTIIIEDQPVSDSVLIKYLRITDPDGGYVTIQFENASPGYGMIAETGLLPPGTYEDFGFLYAYNEEGVNGIDAVQSGSELYAVVYGEDDGQQGREENARVLKDGAGRLLIKRFVIQ